MVKYPLQCHIFSFINFVSEPFQGAYQNQEITAACADIVAVVTSLLEDKSVSINNDTNETKHWSRIIVHVLLFFSDWQSKATGHGWQGKASR